MLKREAAKLNGETISIANSSDPYPRAEASEGLTRRCLEILAESNCRIQIITKSNLVARDDDLLCKVPATVALTITTDDDNLAKVIEPFAPSPVPTPQSRTGPNQSRRPRLSANRPNHPTHKRPTHKNSSQPSQA